MVALTIGALQHTMAIGALQHTMAIGALQHTMAIGALQHTMAIGALQHTMAIGALQHTMAIGALQYTMASLVFLPSEWKGTGRCSNKDTFVAVKCFLCNLWPIDQSEVSLSTETK